MHDLVIISTGISNVASVRAMALRAGIDPIISSEPSIVMDAKAVILPGVGSFGAGMSMLTQTGLDRVVRQRVEQGRSLLAICLGMQMLFESSDESPGIRGLGLAEGEVKRFTEVSRIPHMGWNELRANEASRIFRTADVYYANSYRVIRPPQGWRSCTTRYGAEFVGAIEFENAPCIAACQFHPELSGSAGMAIFSRWLELSRSPVPC